MNCQPVAPLESAWIQTPLHVSCSVTIALTTFPRLFGHFLESLIAIIFLLVILFNLFIYLFLTAGYRPGKEN